MISRLAKRTVEALILVYAAAVVILAITGGWAIDVAGLRVTSYRAAPLFQVLVPLLALRGALAIGWKQTLLVAVSTAAALGVAELVLRVLFPDPRTSDLVQIHRPSPDLQWDLVPGVRGIGMQGEVIAIDAEGRRDDASGCATDSLCVAAVGDSFTFGMGVPLADAWPKRLQSRLARETGTTVLNYGVIGYQLWQLARVLEHRVPVHGPDAVVLALFCDDIGEPLAPEPVVASNPFFTPTDARLNGVRTFDLARQAGRVLKTRYRHLGGAAYLRGIEARREQVATDPRAAQFNRAQLGTLDPATYAGARSTIGRIAQWRTATGIPLLAVQIPDASQLGVPERQAVNRFFAAELDRADIPFLDLTPVFEAESDWRSLYLMPLDAHTSPRGHDVIAAALAAHPFMRNLVVRNLASTHVLGAKALP